MGGVVKAVTKPFRKIGGAVKKAVSSTFKIFKQPKVETPEPPPPAAPAAPEAESVTSALAQNEDLKAQRRKGRRGLRIDLNTGGSGKSGINLPRG